MTPDLPAILGGAPVFAQPLGIVRPLLPPLEAIYDRLEHAMATGQLTNNGQYVRQLEDALADYLGVAHAVTVSNATLGLIILDKVLAEDAAGDEIIMPSFTFSATAHAAVWVGLKPVFADILPDTYTLDPTSVARLISDRTAAIMGVHIYGHPCEIAELQAVADEHGVPLVFDAAHAFGSRYRERRVGCFGLAEVFSFHATKIFPVGEGGVITTDDDALAARLRLWRTFGDVGDENTQLPGLNAKMQEFNALIGLENLPVVDGAAEHRRAIARLIREELIEIPGLTFQTQRDYVYSNYQNFSVLIDDVLFGLNRDQLFEALRAENVGARKYFYPLHQHDTYANAAEWDLPVTDHVAARVLCLPIYSDMSEELAREMCAAIRRIQAHASSVHNYLDIVSGPGL